MHPEPEFLLIGRIVGTFGWAGEVKVRPETDFPQRFCDLKEVWIECPDGSRQKCRIEASRIGARQVRVKFAGYSNKEEAAGLRGSLILIPAAEAVSLPTGHYFLHQILGLRVHTTDGKELGEIVEIIRAPAHDVYVTLRAEIPARKEVVKEIDLERGIMVVDMSTLNSERSTQNDAEI